MSIIHILLIVLLVGLLFGGLPNTPWGGWHRYGYYPSGIGLILLVILVIVLLRGG
jgi:hypothetical protein